MMKVNPKSEEVCPRITRIDANDSNFSQKNYFAPLRLATKPSANPVAYKLNPKRHSDRTSDFDFSHDSRLFALFAGSPSDLTALTL
jgi:hypothetical protein